MSRNEKRERDDDDNDALSSPQKRKMPPPLESLMLEKRLPVVLPTPPLKKKQSRSFRGAAAHARSAARYGGSGDVKIADVEQQQAEQQTERLAATLPDEGESRRRMIKGLRGLLRSYRRLPNVGVSPEFEVPEPQVVNQYWVYLPVPQKRLFLDLLQLEPQSAPPASPQLTPPPFSLEPTDEEVRQSEAFDDAYERVQNEYARALVTDPTMATSLELQLQEMDAQNQSALFERARLLFMWTLEKERLEAPFMDHLKAENERKAEITTYVHDALHAQRRHHNGLQKSILELELPKAIASIGGTADGRMPDDEQVARMSRKEQLRVEAMQERIPIVLDKLRVSSLYKKQLGNLVNNGRGVLERIARPLTAHVPVSKGKYVKTGDFTREKRAEKIATARPYNKTGGHINDFMKPRFPEIRDRQLVERATMLGVSTEEFRASVMPD